MPGDRGRTCGCTTTIVLCAALASPGLAGAQRRGGGDEPIVSALELYGTLEGDRARDLDPGRGIELTPQQSLTIEAEPRDQYGRRFPTDRFHMGAELGRDCRGVLSVSERSAGELQFTAGRERGACRALVWVAGNLNLEFELRFEVTGLGTAKQVSPGKAGGFSCKPFDQWVASTPPRGQCARSPSAAGRTPC